MFFLTIYISHAQNNRYKWGLQINSNIGKIIKHAAKFIVSPSEASYSVDMIWQRLPQGNKYWERIYKRSTLGLLLSYHRFGDHDTYGSAITLIPTWQRNIKYKNTWNLYCRMGSGLTYLSSPFHPYYNKENVVIGSKINNCTSITLGANIKIEDKLDFTIQSGITHFSNGAIQLPNLGINLIHSGAGIRYQFREKRKELIYDSLPPIAKRISIQTRIGIGSNERSAIGGPKYPIYIYTIAIGKQWGQRRKLQLGCDYYYYPGIKSAIINNENSVGNINLASSKSALFIAHEYIVGQFGLLTQLGYYFYNPFLSVYPIYFKIGAQQYIPLNKNLRQNRLLAGIYLKTHFGDAELMAFAIGYEW